MTLMKTALCPPAKRATQLSADRFKKKKKKARAVVRVTVLASMSVSLKHLRERVTSQNMVSSTRTCLFTAANDTSVAQVHRERHQYSRFLHKSTLSREGPKGCKRFGNKEDTHCTLRSHAPIEHLPRPRQKRTWWTGHRRNEE